ncbi:hypothetical protein AWC38_SpisGene2090 [Stylophora pistillata]|uniref:CCHC-type domain-containing protein n=1 Tax=Stylophora pistillata TaxID=50429 RepID=A0A2B4SSW1_STYPI|nr:hypothetical protein AWC38_SpisGene2090 [Stylophora pistillata]
MAEGGYDLIKPSSRLRQRNRTLDWEGIDAESLRNLKQARGRKKGIIISAQEEIKQLLLDSSHALLVKEKLDTLHRAFQDFVSAHAEYHNQLKKECDIDESNEYFKLVEQANGWLVCEISRWVVASNPTTSKNPIEEKVHGNDVTPTDLISNAGSRQSRRSGSSFIRSKGSAASSVQSARAKAAAKKAMLKVEAKELENWQALKMEELALEMKKTSLELQTEIGKATAEELAHAQVQCDTGESLMVHSVDQKPGAKAPLESTTDASQIIDAQRKEFGDRATAEGYISDQNGVTDSSKISRLQVNAVAPPNYNPVPVKHSPISPAMVKPEPNKPAQNTAFSEYTSAEVQELVKSCLSMGEDSGYRTARKLLHKTYGSSYKIASAYEKNLTRGPAIKAEDGEALQSFALALTSCKSSLTEISYLNKLENPDTFTTIVQRLPFGLRQKWPDTADNITETQDREITIADLSNFVSARARVTSHAIFGDVSSQAPQPHGGPGVRHKSQPLITSSFATNMSTSHNGNVYEERNSQVNRKCPLCKSNHWLSQCSNFKEKSLAARWQLVTSRGLCTNCLVAGHSANSCPKRGFCRVTGFPVKVKAPDSDLIVETYAFLDNGSNVSFNSEDLANQLGLSGCPTSLHLTTMDREESRSAAQIISLHVTDLEEENLVELLCVYKNKAASISKERSPQQLFHVIKRQASFRDLVKDSSLEGRALPDRFAMEGRNPITRKQVPQRRLNQSSQGSLSADPPAYNLNTAEDDQGHTSKKLAHQCAYAYDYGFDYDYD